MSTEMGFRFQKRIRLFKGVTLNLSKSGTSVSVGGRGASLNLKGDKITGTVGVPGTGLSYRETMSASQSGETQSPAKLIIYAVIVLALLAMFFG
jgi:hypothetical protein